MPSKLEQFKTFACDCSGCQIMCRRPCFPTIEDAEKLIEAGFADRLCIDHWADDDWPAQVYFLCPALKGSEKRSQPFYPMSDEGCTFWNREKKCDLHELGLKPMQGKLAGHQNETFNDKYTIEIIKPWDSKSGFELIERWKKLVGYKDESPISEQEKLDFILKMLTIK